MKNESVQLSFLVPLPYNGNMNEYLFHMLLGAVQGLTEFLPISSSAHLVIVNALFGFGNPNIFFDTLLHLATLVAVFIFFWKEILHIKPLQIKMIIIGSIPAAIVGIFFKDFIEGLFGWNLYIGVELIISGLLNFWADRMLEQQKNSSDLKTEVGMSDAVVIGIAQAIAISPGISRSGSTVTAALARGITRQEAFTYSFLLSIPAIAGAGFLQIRDVLQVNGTIALSPAQSVGIVTAFVSGLLTLSLFKIVVTRSKLEYFGWYCMALGVAFISFSLLQ